MAIGLFLYLYQYIFPIGKWKLSYIKVYNCYKLVVLSHKNTLGDCMAIRQLFHSIIDCVSCISDCIFIHPTLIRSII